jgi:zinc transport system ATP-binding protein
MSDTPAIELRDVSFAYNGAPVLEEVSLRVGAGEMLSVVGPNGGGKTTLLRVILGLLTPDRGEVRVFGNAPREARSTIGYVPQQAHHDLRFPVTVRDVVLMGRLGRTLTGWAGKADRAAAARALADVGLDGYGPRRYEALSGGERQRVLIARALAGEPRLLLLDEPTANVDPGVEQRLSGILERLRGRMTLVMVSHDLSLATALVDHVLCVNRGVAMHPTSEVTRDNLSALFGDDVRLIRHDRDCLTEGHRHD